MDYILGKNWSERKFGMVAKFPQEDDIRQKIIFYSFPPPLTSRDRCAIKRIVHFPFNSIKKTTITLSNICHSLETQDLERAHMVARTPTRIYYYFLNIHLVSP